MTTPDDREPRLSLPARLAISLFRLAAPADAREDVLGDLQERFSRRAAAGGAWRAHLWLWTQTLGAVPRFLAASWVRIVHPGGRSSGLSDGRGRAGAGLLSDTRFALRTLMRSPAFTVTAVGVLAVGLGATAVMSSVVRAVVLRPLPYPDSERLVRIWGVDEEGRRHSSSAADFLDFEERNRTFEALAATTLDIGRMTLLGGPQPEALAANAVTRSLFTVLGVEPALGRTFTADEARLGSDERVALLGHEIWRQRFGGDPAIVGTQIDLDGSLRTVVGVLPEGFRFFRPADVWVPFVPDPNYPRGDHRLEVFGKMRPGVTIEQANEDLTRIAAELEAEYPESNVGRTATAATFSDWLIGPRTRRISLALLAAGVLLLLLAALNVSGLMIARAVARRSELGLRAALGAGRGRIVRQLLVESVVLAIPGTALGLLLAFWAAGAIRAMSWQALPRLDEIALDGRVLAVSLLCTVGTAIVCGLAPAVHASTADPREGLDSGSRSEGRGTRVREVLVVAQLAFAVVLLSGAGLLASSFLRLRGVDPGFDPEGVLTATLSLPADRYPQLSRQTAQFYDQVLDRVGAIPGVVATGATMVNPFLGFNPSNTAATATATEQREFMAIRWRAVTRGFFEAMSAPPVAGRTFVAHEGDERVAIVSTTLAEQLWPDENPVGRQLRFGQPGGALFRIVGVVRALRDTDLASAPEPTLYLAQQQIGWPDMTLVIKTAVEPLSIAGEVRRAIWAVDPAIPIPELQPLTRNLEQAVVAQRFSAQGILACAVAALLMAAVGLYGVVSFVVASRTREIGIRMAIGAEPAAAARAIVRRGLSLAAWGVVLGGLGAVMTSRVLRSLLYGSGPAASVILTVAVVMAVTVALATAVPAWRASRVDPAEALRR